MVLVVKNSGDLRDAGSIPGSGRSLGEWNGNPLQYSSLENPMDRGAWWATLLGVTKSQTWLKQLSTDAQEHPKVMLQISLERSALWHSAFFKVQLSHLYMTSGKTIALTTQTFVSKVMSLLFNMLSRFVIVFLPQEQASFNFMASSAVILEAQENEVCHCFHCFLIYLSGSDGTRCHDLSFLNAKF